MIKTMLWIYEVMQDPKEECLKMHCLQYKHLQHSYLHLQTSKENFAHSKIISVWPLTPKPLNPWNRIG